MKERGFHGNDGFPRTQRLVWSNPLICMLDHRICPIQDAQDLLFLNPGR
jgi:hypothetical protein